MNKIIILLVILLSLSANEIINGETEILKVDGEFAGELFINDKKSIWLDNPVKKGEKIAFVSSNYRNKNDIIVKHIFNNDEQIIKFKLIEGSYKKENITVSSSKANPNKENLKRIKKESKEAYSIYRAKTDKLLFNSKFELPINSVITSNFGNARIFNGNLKSYHSGTDFRASVGTPIKAANDGVVVIAKERFYAGNSVVINHGGGIYSQYYHLSKINVEVGNLVKKGEVIGLSGATGRVSGPHLHFGIMVNANSVEPLKFIEAINYALFDK